jgi:hypothetical protein
MPCPKERFVLAVLDTACTRISHWSRSPRANTVSVIRRVGSWCLLVFPGNAEHSPCCAPGMCLTPGRDEIDPEHDRGQDDERDTRCDHEEEDQADELGDDRLERPLEQLQVLRGHGHLLTPRLYGSEQSGAGTDEMFVVKSDKGR